MKNNIILFAVATLALNSCGIYKKYEPVATLPENLYREEIAPADTFSIGNISWRDLFTDPALQSLIERGLANNTDLRIAHLKVQEAEVALMTSRLSYLPSLSLDPQARQVVSIRQKRRGHTTSRYRPVGRSISSAG